MDWQKVKCPVCKRKLKGDLVIGVLGIVNIAKCSKCNVSWSLEYIRRYWILNDQIKNKKEGRGKECL